jgi:hypothetical protein
MSYPANPNPSRITDTLWRFRCDCLALEAGSGDQDGGIYANKPGYHNTRAANDPDNYSVRDAPDKKGPSDKAAAWDWTFGSAQNGDYSRISDYGKKMLRAWEDRDPRTNVLREWLGQTDMDSTPEGLDFRYHTKRTPDGSHAWHIHKSFVRAYIDIPGALNGVLSIYNGQTLDEFLLNGGKLYKIDGTGELTMAVSEVNLYRGRPAPAAVGTRGSGVLLDDLWAQEMAGHSPYDTDKSYRTKQLDDIQARVKNIEALLKNFTPGTGGGLSAADHSGIVNDVKTALKDGTA